MYNIVLEVLTNTVRLEIETRGVNAKKEATQSNFQYDVVAFVGKLIEKLLDLITKEYRVTRFKTNSLKLVVFLYGSNNCLENIFNIKEHFNSMQKRVKLCS